MGDIIATLIDEDARLVYSETKAMLTIYFRRSNY